MPDPLVSLCVPTRNRGNALRESLPRILAQRYEPLEIIISDNGSTDDTEALCREAADRDPRIRYFRHPHNIGLYGNHNFLIEQARGEFLCFFHDHDERDDELVREYVSFLQRHPGVGVVCSDWKLIDESGKELGNRFTRMAEVTPGLSYIDQTFRSGSTSLGIPGTMIRRSALGETRFNKKMDEEKILGFGDFPFWFRIAEEHDVGHLSKVLWYWRQDPQSQSAQAIKWMARDYEENLSRYCDEHLARWPRHASRVARWRREIRRYLFWALAYQVGLYFSKADRPKRREEQPTLLEILDHQLEDDALPEVIGQMRKHRTGALQHLAFPLIRGGVRLKAAHLFTWTTTHVKFFRRLLRLC